MSDKFNKIYQESINSPEKFWQEASNDIFWFKKPNKILNKSKPPFYKWFEDGLQTLVTMHWIFILIKVKVKIQLLFTIVQLLVTKINLLMKN